MAKIVETVSKLSPQLQKEVENFALFLTRQGRPSSTCRLRQDWAGALNEYREAFTSMDLQKKALEWRLE
ncbi:MAG: DUF2281 domain-containing protein [Verrucomicrobiota bacterium]